MQYWQRKLQRSVTEMRTSPMRPAVPVDERLSQRAPHARWKSDFPPVLSSSSTRSITTPGSMPLTMS